MRSTTRREPVAGVLSVLLIVLALLSTTACSRIAALQSSAAPSVEAGATDVVAGTDAVAVAASASAEPAASPEASIDPSPSAVAQPGDDTAPVLFPDCDPNPVGAIGAPTDLVADPTVDAGWVDLRWVGPKGGPKACGFNVYRDGEAVGDGSPENPTFFDQRVPSGVHVYTVTAVDSRRLESEPSAPVTVDMTEPTFPPCALASAPPAVAHVHATATAWNRVELSWDAVDPRCWHGSDPAYVVYRGSMKVATLHADVTSFVDATTKPSTTYHYSVAAMREYSEAPQLQYPEPEEGPRATVRVGTPSQPRGVLVATLTSPPISGTLFAEEPLSAAASGGRGAVSITFLVDGTAIATDRSSPYAVTWDTTHVADGPHGLSVRATDASGATCTSEPLRVTVMNGSSAVARVMYDFIEGRISPTEFTLYGTFAMLAMQAGPPRYRSDVPDTGDGMAEFAFITQYWKDLSPASEELLTAVIDSPWHGDGYDGPVCPPAPIPGWPKSEG